MTSENEAKSKFNPPNEMFIGDYRQYERDPMGYAIQVILWFVEEVTQRKRFAWTESVDENFLAAVFALLEYFDKESSISVHQLAEELRERLALWRDTTDGGSRLFAEMSHIVRGDPGEYLEYPGPVIAIDFDTALEGITTDYLLNEWELNEERSALAYSTLALSVVAEIVTAIFWVSRANGKNLDNEIKRLFQTPGNRQALRGQLANLILAGQAASWKKQIEFISEISAPTPDWLLREANVQMHVECTSFRRQAKTSDDHRYIGEVVAKAWSEKREKFRENINCGLISVDISGIIISREFGGIVRRDLGSRFELPAPNGDHRTFGVYRLREDMEMMAKESRERGPLAVLASALHSQDAKAKNIKGFLLYQGQVLHWDYPGGQIARPKRGMLAWRGDIGDPELRLAACLTQPPVPFSVPKSEFVPCSIFLV